MNTMDITFSIRKFQKSLASLTILAVLTSLLSFVGIAQAATLGSDVYPDVSASDWYDEAAGNAYDMGYITGEGDGTFNGAADINNAAAAKTIVMLLGVETTSYDFGATDLAADAWYTPYIETVVMLGIWDEASEMNPEMGLTREDTATVLLRAWGLSTMTGLENPFSDVTSGSADEDSILTANYYGLMTGQDATTFGVGSTVNRAEWATVLGRTPTEPEVETPVDEGDDDDDDDDVVVEDGGDGGDLTVILADSSPEDYTTIVQGTNAEVAVFELTANNGAVEISSFDLELVSGDTGLATAYAIYDGNGTRVSRVDTSLSSENVAHMTMLDGGLVISDGTSEDFHVMVTVAAGADTSTFNTFMTTADMVTSNANSVDAGDEGIETNIISVISNSLVGALSVDDNGSISNPELGGTEETIAEFELEETGSEQDTYLMGITFENTGSADLEEAITDVYLLNNTGDMLAEGVINGDYLSFQLEEGALVEQDDTEDFEVVAKIIGEFGETLIFDIEETLDVFALDEAGNNVGITITDYTVASNTSTIDAGTISVAFNDASSDEMRDDKNDVELGSFDVTVGADNIYIDSFNLDFTAYLNGTEAAAAQVAEILEEIELYSSDFGVIDLSCSTSGTAGSLCTNDDELDLDGGDTYTFVIRADTIDAGDGTVTGFALFDTTATSYDELSVDVAFANLGTTSSTGGIEFKERQNDDEITDVTPSSETLKEVTGTAAGFDANIIALSSSLDAVIGTNGVLALEIDFEEDQGVSDLMVDDLTFGERTTDVVAAFSSTTVNSVELYAVYEGDDTEYLVESKGGSDISSETITFDNIAIPVYMDTITTFRVYVNLVEDTANDGETIRLALTAYSVEDDEGDNVYASQDNGTLSGTANDGVFNGTLLDNDAPTDADDEMDGVTSAREITVQDKGTLLLEMVLDDNTTGTDDPRWFTLGEDAVVLATIAATADNEMVEIEDMVLDFSASDELDVDASGDIATLEQIFERIYVAEADGTEIASETSGSASFNTTTGLVTFEDMNWFVPADETTYYIMADLQSYGEEENGAIGVIDATFNLQITKAEGADSGEALTIDLTPTTNSGDVTYVTDPINAALTAESTVFGFVASQIATIAFVDENEDGTVSVGTTLTGGENTIAIIEVTVPATDNKTSTNGSIETVIDTFFLTISKDSTALGMHVENVTLKALETDEIHTEVTSDAAGTTIGADGDLIQGTSTDDLTFDLTGFVGGNTIDPGQTVYFEVIADVTLTVNSDSEFIQVSMDDLEGTGSGNVTWQGTAELVTSHTDIRMGISTLDAPKLVEAS
jgi:hypothetical protein